MPRAIVLLLAAVLAASAATPGYISISIDSMPAEVYFDATTVVLQGGPVVVEATPGKHFVSLFPPKRVYQAAYDQAPEHFWGKLRELGAVPDKPGLLSSYEAGSIRTGTHWVYVTPDDTFAVALSQAEVKRVYQRDTGCLARTFFGWTILIGAAMVVSILLAAIGT